MKYLLLVYSPEQAWTRAEWEACAATSTELCRELQARGQFHVAAPLHQVATAVSVRVRPSGTLITTGPFAETTEQLGGFFLIEVADLDQAIAIAARLPSAHKGTIEIRPLLDLDGLPANRLGPATSAAPPPARYLLLCYDAAQAWDELGADALDAARAEAVGLAVSLDAEGRYLSASALNGVATATAVRIRQGRLLVTDGPFAETREFLGGYYLLTAGSVDDALAIAARHPGARYGTVEVRRLVELPA